jgi:hypothetical protein
MYKRSYFSDLGSMLNFYTTIFFDAGDFTELSLRCQNKSFFSGQENER